MTCCAHQVFKDFHLYIIILFLDAACYAHHVFKAFDVNATGAISFRVGYFFCSVLKQAQTFSAEIVETLDTRTHPTCACSSTSLPFNFKRRGTITSKWRLFYILFHCTVDFCFRKLGSKEEYLPNPLAICSLCKRFWTLAKRDIQRGIFNLKNS